MIEANTGRLTKEWSGISFVRVLLGLVKPMKKGRGPKIVDVAALKNLVKDEMARK